jgi:DNA polymerase-3 subunit alpha
MRITDIDPLEFKLLFERFLNPERISMPDFDVDFCMNRRDEVIKYVQEKYGREQVGQIATFHQLKARGVIRDIARAMEIPFAEADKLAKLVPEPVAGKTPAGQGGDREHARAQGSSTTRARCTASCSTSRRRSRASTATPACTPPAS